MTSSAPSLGWSRTLRGLTATFGRLDHEGYSEPDTERRSDQRPQSGACRIPVSRPQVAGTVSCRRLLHLPLTRRSHAHRLIWNAAANFETAEFEFYGALARSGAHEAASGDLRQQHLDALIGHHKQLEAWAQHNPVTFESRAALAGAEIARIQGRVLDAQDLYEKAVRSAHTHGFVHVEAIANERAGCFYAARGFETIATAYLRDARSCYRRWGADAKVRQLEQLYPQIGAEESIADATATIQTPVEQLDLATVIKVSEAVVG